MKLYASGSITLMKSIKKKDHREATVTTQCLNTGTADTVYRLGSDPVIRPAPATRCRASVGNRHNMGSSFRDTHRF